MVLFCPTSFHAKTVKYKLLKTSGSFFRIFGYQNSFGTLSLRPRLSKYIFSGPTWIGTSPIEWDSLPIPVDHIFVTFGKHIRITFGVVNKAPNNHKTNEKLLEKSQFH